MGGQYVTDPNAHPFDLSASPANSMTVTVEWDSLAGYDLDLEVLAPDGSVAGEAVNYNVPGDSSETPIIIDDASLLGQLGTWTVNVYSAGSYECSYTVTVAFA